MATWTEVGHILAHHGQLGVPLTTVSFDPHSELLWSGSTLGTVASHLGPGLQRYTSWAAHTTSSNDGAKNRGRSAPFIANNAQPGTRGLLVDDKNVYSVGEGGLKASNRRGLTRWNMFARLVETSRLFSSSSLPLDAR